MATPAQLMQTISDATGVPLATITDIDRRLVTAGLRTKGGRGFSAARMTPLDAARLLTAILASPQANVSAAAVERYAGTRVDREQSGDKLFAATKLDELIALPADHSFIDALTALIAAAATGSLAQMIAKSDGSWTPKIEVFAFTRATRGRMRLAGMPNKLTASVEYALPPTGGSRKHTAVSKTKPVAPAGEISGDLEQSRRITERTILSIAELLREEI